jgi:hypothetical protein
VDIDRLFFEIDEHVKNSCENIFITMDKKKTGQSPRMAMSEIMTILVLYHSSNFKNFKSFYFYLLEQKREWFPRILSYSRFIEWMPYSLIPLYSFMKTQFGKSTGINFIDSTPISVCKNIRINRNKTFKNIAERGKSSMGWFYGLKLHIVVNEKGEILSMKITKGNVNDRAPVKGLCKNIFGKLYGDKGYMGQNLFHELFGMGVSLVTNIRSNMKNKIMAIEDKLLLRKRFIIETINDQLKNISDIEHSRHRSPINCIVNIISGLISYCIKEEKPSIRGLNQGNSLILN